MDDRKLLELAAKAAGIDVHDWRTDYQGNPFGWLGGAKLYQITWSPLTDDGDALRLAVQLKLHVGYSGGNQYFACPSDSDKGCMRESGERNGKQDPLAATRRAIVRAAAQIGKSLP